MGGKNSPSFMKGWQAFERGEALWMGTGTDIDFAKGWLAAFSAAFGLNDL